MVNNQSVVSRLKIPDLLFYLAVVLYSLFIYSLTTEYPRNSAYFPKLALYIIFALCFVGLVKLFVRTRSEWASFLTSGGSNYRTILSSVSERSNVRRVAFYLLLLVGFVVLFQTIGFFTASLLITFVHIYYNERNLIISVVGAIAIVLGMYVIFIIALERTLLLRGDIVFETLF